MQKSVLNIQGNFGVKIIMALHRYGDFRVEVFYFDSPCRMKKAFWGCKLSK